MPEINLADADATARLGAALAECLARCSGAVIHLEGNLGAGKTTLARGFLRALGISGAIRSPTYTLMEPYRGPAGPILHLDLYRLADPLELHNLGLSDYAPAETLWLVEWPDKGGALLPPADLRVALTVSGLARRAAVTASDAFVARLGPDGWTQIEQRLQNLP